MTSARNVSFNSQYNFKVIILFYLFRVGRTWRDKDVQLRKQANGLSSSHFRFRFQSVYKYQPCFKVFTSINHVRFAHSWVDKKENTSFKNVWRTWGPALPTLLADLMIFCPLDPIGPTNFKNSDIVSII